MRLNKLLALFIVLLLNMAFWSCDTINPAKDENLVDYTCEGCHSSGATLNGVIELLDLDPPDEGHEAPG